jgi:hypothetical protein
MEAPHADKRDAFYLGHFYIILNLEVGGIPSLCLPWPWLEEGLGGAYTYVNSQIPLVPACGRKFPLFLV